MAIETKSEAAARPICLIYDKTHLLGIFENTIHAHMLANHLGIGAVLYFPNDTERLVREGQLPYRVSLSIDGSRYNIVQHALPTQLLRAIKQTVFYTPDAYVGKTTYEGKIYKVIGPAVVALLWAGSEEEALAEAKKAAKGMMKERRNIDAVYRRIEHVAR